MKFSQIVSVLIFLLIVSTADMDAQVATTSLRGIVTDQSGAVSPGTPVVLERKEVGFRAVRTTDQNGSYQFLQIAPGKYEVIVSSAGFAEQHLTIQLLVDQPATANISLKVESSATSISVDATAAETLNTTNASIGTAVDNATVETLPMEGRNVPDLLSLQPGVLYLGRRPNEVQNLQDSRSGSVAGARSDQGNVTLDGLDNNDQITGQAFTGVLRATLDSVDEFRVSTTNAGVESGRSSGAQVNVVTKGGTNSLHGALYEYNRNTLTAVNDWFNKEAQAEGGLPNTPGKLIRNTFGASVGGAIKKDRLFYFANFEQQRTAENQQETWTVPTASFRAGNITYPGVPSNGSPGGLTTLTPAQFASLDPHCSGLGTCPWGPGDNPNILQVFNSLPLPNGSASGDGYNTNSFSWSAPNPLTLGTYIARLDYTITSRHQLFARGDLQDDTNLSPPAFPGQVSQDTLRDNTKGIAVGEIWTINPHLVNNLRYGFTRQGFSHRGAGTGPYVQLASISNPVGETRTTLTYVPQHNIIDDLDWTKGKHNLQFGINYRLIHSIADSNAYTYNSASSSTGEYFDSLANTGQDLDPSAYPELGYPDVAPGFDNSYSYAAMNLAGVICNVSLNYVYKVDSSKNGTLLPQGTLVNRNFKTNQFDYYVEDTYQVRPKLTVTFGVRHSLAQTPYEINGQQVSESVSMGKWFDTRVADAQKGIVDQPNYSYVLSGKANNGKPMWQMAKWDIAPRVGIAYAPDSKTSIRAGGGLNYDNFGLAIANRIANGGSAGLLGSTSTLAGWVSTAAAARFTGLQNIPLYPGVLVQPAATTSFPFNPPLGAEAGANTVDDGLKTPHSFQADLSVQRQLPSGFTLEVAYVGRFGRRTLQSRDIAMPLDLVDPQSGMDYFKAADLLETQFYNGVKAQDVQPIAYWENLFPDAANLGVNCNGGCVQGYTATQNIFNHFATNPLNASYGIYSMDIACNPGCGGQHNRYYASQYSNLNVQSSMGTTSYNSGQIILRHPMSHGLQTDFSYTLGKSFDLGSDADRIAGGAASGSSSTYWSGLSQILNAFNPKLNRAVSDFDTKHLITADWVYALPFGRSQRFLNTSNGLLNSVFGGWGFTGLGRWTSGLPFGSQIASGWVTSWSYQDFIVKTGNVKMHTHNVPGGGPQAFANPEILQNALSPFPNYTASPVRWPLPGEVGSRNAFRGDGYFGIDSGLNKTWHVRERYALKFAWEVFNVTNSVRFDTNTNFALQGIINEGNFGHYGTTLTQGRVQQFSLRLTY